MVLDLARIVPWNFLRLHILAVFLGKPLSQFGEFFLAHEIFVEFVADIGALARLKFDYLLQVLTFEKNL